MPCANFDSKLSPTHKRILDQWQRDTSKANDPQSIIHTFVKPARDALLIGANFEA